MRKSIFAACAALSLSLTIPFLVRSAEVEVAKPGAAGAVPAINRTKGVVKELDAKKGTVTLAHEAVTTLKWPAMTMTFRISPELAKGIEVGQKVEFEFQYQGTVGTITKIAPSH